MPGPISAGLLLYRRSPYGLEVLLGHPGGPLYENRDEGAWSIPKGKAEGNELLLEAAIREFEEETGFLVDGPFQELGAIVQKSGKTVHAWACEGSIDAKRAKSNLIRFEWPRKSGEFLVFPEIDRCEWFTIPIARTKINPAQAEFFERLEKQLSKN